MDKYVDNFDNKYTLVKCVLKTGRTHQIRVHLKYINHPVLGDDLYDQYLDEFRQRLHAYKLSFKHINGKDMEFIADCPKEFYENVPEIYKP